MEKAKVAGIHNEITAALKAIAAKHNLSFTKNNVIFSDIGFKLNAEFGDKEALGDVPLLLVKNLQKYGWQYDLSEKDLKRKFTLRGNEYEFYGMQGNYCIGKDAKGNWKLPIPEVVAALKK